MLTFKTNNKITVSSKKDQFLFDTSVLIDGRIVAVAQAGFF